MKAEEVKCVVAEISPTQYFAIRTAINVALHTDILPNEDRAILEKIKDILPTVKVVEE